MAWQLIYTSAPRLLEAGRTGFGTVARHRAVGGMLAASVERFSQFARLPGHDPRRVVHACRILTVGSGTYHVLSCLQDAGSDYTGRTNHIAHHLIAEPREIRALSAAGLTPADVLLGMAWRTSWSEGPRYLDPAEEIDLSSFAASASSAWTAVTGSPASAGILWSREALKGCYLIIPPGISALELFRESLLVEQAQAWQTRFTTCLEPNDDLADFRWVALSSASPLRAQVETSSRLVLDLTRPDTLPAPPQPEPPAPVPESVSPAAPESVQPLPPSIQEQSQTPAPVGSMGGWSPEPHRKAAKSNRSFIVISLVIAAVMILAVVGMLLRQNNLQVQARSDYEKEIAKTWKDHQLILNDTRKLLEEQADLESGKELLKSHEVFFNGMEQLLRKPGTPEQLALPSDNKDDLRELRKLLDEWAELNASPWANLQTGKDAAADILSAYRQWQDARHVSWKRLSAYIHLNGVPPPADGVVQSLKDKAGELLRLAEPTHGSSTNWEQVFKLPGHKNSSANAEALHWLKLWTDLDDPNASTYATAQTASANDALPEWLRAKAADLKQRQDQENERLMAAKNKPAADHPPKEIQQPKIVFEDADAMTATNGIYICLLQPNEDPAGRITGLKMAADMQLYVGTAWEMHPSLDGKTEPKNGELKKWTAVSLDGRPETKFGPTLLAKLTDMIVFSNDGTLAAIPESWRRSSNGIRIVAHSKDAMKVLFDLRLIPISSVASRPIFTPVIETTVDNVATVTLSLPSGFLSRLHLVGQKDPVYSLRRDGSATEQKFFELKPAGDSEFEVLPPQSKPVPAANLLEIRRQIAELEAGIAKDERDLAGIDPKLPARQQEEKRETYTKGMSDKTIKLQELQAKLPGLGGLTPLSFVLLPGPHTLLLEQQTKLELCRLNVVSATGHSQSKPSNP